MACAPQRVIMLPSQYSLGTTVFSYNCVNNLHSLYCVFKMFMIIKLPALCVSDTFFVRKKPICCRHLPADCDIYGATGTCEGKVCKWVRHCNAGRDSFGWEVLDHLPYSLDLKPSDLRLFRYLKHHLRGNRYNDKEIVKTAVTFWLSEQAVSFFDEDIQNSVIRYDASLNKHGSYVEK